MDKNFKNNKNTRHIYRRVNFVINGDKYKIHRIEWCEGGLKLSDIETKNIGENDLNNRMKYIMASIDN